MLYLGLDDTKRGRPRKSKSTGSRQKTPSGMIFFWKVNFLIFQKAKFITFSLL
jgi:hypothetical protein